MKLLICTQKVDKNDSVLGFFHRWLEEFAKHCEKVTVICLEKGEYELPQNVKVLSLGKEAGVNKLKYFWRFYRYIWKLRKGYDSVFVHMNPEYVVLGGWLWRLMGKKISLWYVHRQVNLKLRIAAFFAHKIFSVSPESFRLKSKKVNFVGHGIDTEFFKCENRQKNPDVFKIISVGRITRIKNLDVLIDAIGMLSGDMRKKISMEIVGGPVTKEDEKYLQELKNSVKIKQLDEFIKFTGPIPHYELANLYCRSDLLVNLCPTGGMDKVVLEAMSCGLPVVAANESFFRLFGDYGNNLLFKYNEANDLAEKIALLLFSPDFGLGSYLRDAVVNNHNLEKLVKKILS